MMAVLMLLMSTGLHADLTVRKSVEFASVMTGINHSQETIYIKDNLVAVYDSSQSYAYRQLVYDGNMDRVMVINHEDEEYSVYDRAQIDSMINASAEKDGSIEDSRIVSSDLYKADQDSMFQGLRAYKIEAMLDFCCLQEAPQGQEIPVAFRCRARGFHWICDDFEENEIYRNAMQIIHSLPASVTGIYSPANSIVMSRFGFSGSIANQVEQYQNSLGVSGETRISLQMGANLESLCSKQDNLGITFNIDLAYKLLGVFDEDIDDSVYAVPEGYSKVENALGPRYDIEIPGME